MKFLIALFLLSNLIEARSLRQEIEVYQSGLYKNLKLDEQKRYNEVQKSLTEFNKTLEKDGVGRHAIKVGQKVPNYRFPDQSLQDILKKGPVILKFYRGHWCPYCVLELKEYQRIYNVYKKKGVQLVVFTPDRKKYIQKTKRDHKLTFPIYSDPENTISRSLGLTFELTDEVRKIYAQFGINLQESQGNSKNELPMPATLVINKDRRVTFAFYDIDYTKRAEPVTVHQEALKAL